jgi:hypothetical protein
LSALSHLPLRYHFFCAFPVGFAPIAFWFSLGKKLILAFFVSFMCDAVYPTKANGFFNRFFIINAFGAAAFVVNDEPNRFFYSAVFL